MTLGAASGEAPDMIIIRNDNLGPLSKRSRCAD